MNGHGSWNKLLTVMPGPSTNLSLTIFLSNKESQSNKETQVTQFPYGVVSDPSTMAFTDLLFRTQQLK